MEDSNSDLCVGENLMTADVVSELMYFTLNDSLHVEL